LQTALASRTLWADKVGGVSNPLTIDVDNGATHDGDVTGDVELRLRIGGADSNLARIVDAETFRASCLECDRHSCVA